MTVKNIYQQYMIPKNLQQHMLRVAALAKILMADWDSIRIDKKSILQTCLFHDIAKPINFDLTKQASFGMSEVEIRKLEQLQKRLKEYGTDEHLITPKIMQEIGCTKEAILLVENLNWQLIPQLIQNNEISSLVPIYCDMRIGPSGILPIEERISNLHERTVSNDYDDNMKNGSMLEKLMKDCVAIDVNGITESQLTQRFEYLESINIEEV